MLIYIRNQLANRKGTFLIEALVGAVVLAIGVLAMMAAFGRSSDLSGASLSFSSAARNDGSRMMARRSATLLCAIAL